MLWPHYRNHIENCQIYCLHRQRYIRLVGRSRMHTCPYMRVHCCSFSDEYTVNIICIPYYYATIYRLCIDLVCHFGNAYTDVISISDQITHLHKYDYIPFQDIISSLCGRRSIINTQLQLHLQQIILLILWHEKLICELLCCMIDMLLIQCSI
jgi:hypothetical protein